MKELTPKQKEKLKKAVLDGKIVDESSLGVFQMVEDLNDRLDEEIPKITDVIQRMKGDKGDQGEQGIQGEKGDKGDQGIAGSNGKDGVNGKDGKDGKNGINGKDGVDGLDGKDADEESISKRLEQNLPQFGTVFRDGLELLKEDERLDVSAIKGLDGREGKLTDAIVNRAIGIVDERTSFLINKVSNLATQLNNIDNSVNLADVSANSTTTPLSLYTMTSTIPVEFRSSDGNPILYLDETNERIGIGTNAPSRSLSVNSASSAAILGFNRAGTEMGYFGVDTTGVYLSTSAANQIFRFYRNNGGTETARIDASGNFGIGTTTARSLLSVYTAAAPSKITLERGSTGIVSTDEYGSIDFYGNDSSSNASGVRARMVGLAEDNVGKTGLAFYTTTSSSTTLSEIMRVSNVGVGIGTTAPVSKLHISTGVDTDSGVVEMVIGGSNGANARTGRIIKDTTTAYTMIIRSGDYAGTGLGSDLRFQTNNGDGDRITIKGGTGNTGIGVTAPTAVLHLKAGTATASTAPLKFTTGTNNTTAEAGAMEYNNTFHLTNSDATRRHVATAPNTTKVTAGAPYTNDGYVVINIGGTDFKVMTTA